MVEKNEKITKKGVYFQKLRYNILPVERSEEWLDNFFPGNTIETRIILKKGFNN